MFVKSDYAVSFSIVTTPAGIVNTQICELSGSSCFKSEVGRGKTVICVTVRHKCAAIRALPMLPGSRVQGPSCAGLITGVVLQPAMDGWGGWSGRKPLLSGAIRGSQVRQLGDRVVGPTGGFRGRQHVWCLIAGVVCLKFYIFIDLCLAFKVSDRR